LSELTFAFVPLQKSKQVDVDITDDVTVFGRNDSPTAAIADAKANASTQNDASRGISQNVSVVDDLGKNISVDVDAETNWS
jgi:hypothetical protein